MPPSGVVGMVDWRGGGHGHPRCGGPRIYSDDLRRPSPPRASQARTPQDRKMDFTRW